MKRRLLVEVISLLRFGVVGIGASATYILVALVVARAGLPPQGANLLGVVASTTVSFLGHLFYSFRKGGITSRYILRFSVLSLAVYAFSRAGTYAGLTWFEMPYWVVVFAVAAMIPLFTWTAGRFWVFR
jgi:putative flippase GtrA